MIKNIFYLFLLALIYQSCVPAFDENYSGVKIDFQDQEISNVIRLQDEQKIDSLYPFLNDENPNLAYLAARAFGSIQNVEAIDSLAAQLFNPYSEVRAAAAFSLGQMKNANAEKVLIDAFKNKDTLDINNQTNAQILEAIGKCGSERMLSALATTSTYRKTDTLLLLGQSRGIYRFALRGITNQAGTDRMVRMVLDNTYPQKVRVMAANYLGRAKDLDLEENKFQLVKFFTSDPDPNIRMALARALSNTTDIEIHSFLLNQLKIEKDYRVRINILKSLEKFPYEKSADAIIELFNDPNIHVAEKAAQFFVNAGKPSEASIYKTLINDSLDFRVNAKIAEAVFKNLPHYYTNTRKRFAEEIQKIMVDSKSKQEVIAYLRCFSNEPNSYLFLEKIVNDGQFSSVKTAALESMHGLLKSEHFIKTHKSRHIFKRREIADILIKILKSGDAGLLAVIGDIIIDKETKLADIVTETSYLIEARNKLELPKEIETYNKLQEAISLLKGEEFVPKSVEFNYPIDWNILEGITDTSLMILKTTKGNISFTTFPNQAPGSVANFIKLANSNFYDDKTFHRVVPNFVVQGGCPRGDGYGSLDYSIRSEFVPLYYEDEGYIGMASAGPHTEGTQFFITHSPTPHLDGRYTIFGKVNDGMDVVHEILPGDKIKDVIISK